METAYPGCRVLIERALKIARIPDPTLEICLASITPSTLKQYYTGLKLWWQFCQLQKIDVVSPSVADILSFLTQGYQKGLSYGSLNSYRSAIGQLLDPSLTNDFRIQRFFKGVYHLRPNKPKYDNIWNPSTVLDYLRTLKNSEISLKLLSFKLVTLLALSTG